MKRKGICLLMVLLCMLLLCGCNPGGAKDGSWRQVSDAGVLKVGIYTNRFPMCTPMGSKCEGYDADLISVLASRLGVNVIYVDIAQSGKTAEQLMKDGVIDCAVGGIAYHSGLERNFLLSESYLSDEHVIVLPQNSSIGNLADMTGKTVSIAGSSVSMEALRNAPLLKESFGQLNEYGNDVDALMQLTENNTDAVIVPRTVAEYFAANIQPVGFMKREDGTNETLGTMSYVILLPRDSVSLMEKINETYETMKRDHVPQTLYNRWFVEKQHKNASADEAIANNADN
jgi:polar amino acid transport system substrate-binding protein